MDTPDKINNPKLRRLEQMFDFNWLIRQILRLWWVFLLIGMVGGIAGYLYAKSQKLAYKSHLTFALDEGKSGSNSIINLASEFGLNFGSGSSVFSGDNILNIIKSRHIVESVLASVDTFQNKPTTLAEYYLQITGYYKNKKEGDKIYFPAGMSKENYNYRQDSLLKLLYVSFSGNLISAERPDKRLGIYEINVSTPDEKLTKDFTDRLVKQSNSFYSEIRTKKAIHTLTVLEARADTLKRKLNYSINRKADAQDVNINPTFSKAQVPITEQQANIQVYGAAYAELFKNLELARFQYLNDIPLMQIIDQANYPMEKIQHSKLLYAILFAGIACLLLLMGVWLKRIFILSVNESNSKIQNQIV